MGQTSARSQIVAISNALPCAVTTLDAHGYSTGDFVRLTDLNGMMPIQRGEDPVNNYRWEIVVTGTTTFTLRFPVTHVDVDSTNYTPYVTGGSCNLVQTNFYYNAN